MARRAPAEPQSGSTATTSHFIAAGGCCSKNACTICAASLPAVTYHAIHGTQRYPRHIALTRVPFQVAWCVDRRFNCARVGECDGEDRNKYEIARNTSDQEHCCDRPTHGRPFGHGGELVRGGWRRTTKTCRTPARSRAARGKCRSGVLQTGSSALGRVAEVSGYRARAVPPASSTACVFCGMTAFQKYTRRGAVSRREG
jgi:hypothetical protein